MMAQRMQTRISREYLEEIKWTLQWSSLNPLNQLLSERYGVAPILYRIAHKQRRFNTSLDTVDALYMALVDRFLEVGLPVPSDLWERLLVHEWIEEDTEGTPTEDETP